MKCLFLVSVLIAVSLAEYYPPKQIYKDDPYWTEVSVTFCASANRSDSCFETMPLTAYEAMEEGWVLVSNDCENYGRYNGYRYVYEEDWSLVLIYDRYGFLSGIQTHMRVDELTCSNTNFHYNFKHVPYFLITRYEGVEYYTLTSYFQNPRTICDSGRSLPEYLKEGLGGEGVWFQYGNSPYVTDFVPSYRPAAFEKHWNKAQCFGAMGYHNFKNMHKWEEDNCQTIPPYSVLYDRDDYMRGYVFMALGNATSKYRRYEHLPSAAVQFVMNGDAAPKCVKEYQDACGATTMHVYFVRKPYTFIC